MGDLDKLIEAVEAGQWLSVLNVAAKVFPNETPNIGARNCYYWVLDAYRGGGVLPGGLDAALRLHEALLPGWDYSIDNVQRVKPFVYVVDDGGPEFHAEAGTPARAFLLAILRALQAQRIPPISPEQAQFNAVRHHERFGPLDEKGNPADPRRRG